MYKEEATLECVTNDNEMGNKPSYCHTDCGPFWNDDND